MSYDGDVAYEVWRNGGNPDCVDPDRCDDARWDGISAESHAHTLFREANDRRMQAQQAEYEAQEAYYQELAEREHYAQLEREYYAELECEAQAEEARALVREQAEHAAGEIGT